MRWLAVLAGVCVATSACGGATSKSDGGDGAGSQGGAVTTNGGAATTGGSATSELLGDPTDPRYPAVPPQAEGAFFWRYGLGNWFVTKSDDTIHDANRNSDTGGVAWKAVGAAEQSLDLWAQLNHPIGTPVDLSPYTGVSFDARLTGASAPLVLIFNAMGQYQQASAALDAQRFNATSDWQTFTLRFDDIAYDASSTSSFDFIVTSPAAPYVLEIRNLSLLCKSSCP